MRKRLQKKEADVEEAEMLEAAPVAGVEAMAAIEVEEVEEAKEGEFEPGVDADDELKDEEEEGDSDDARPNKISFLII